MMARIRILLLGFVLLSVLVSALAVVYAKYQSRSLFVQSNRLGLEIDRLNMEWKQLLIEHATWGAPYRIEREARRKLHMRLPSAHEVVVVRGRDGG